MKIFKRFIFGFKNDWYQFFKGKFNWYSFHFVHIYFEYEKMTEGLEFWFYLFGVGFYVRYNLPASDKIFEEFDKEIKEIKTKKDKLTIDEWCKEEDKIIAEVTRGSKNSKKLSSLIKYCIKHPELRFWQALRNWSKAPFIIKSSHYDASMFNDKFMSKNKVETSDTYYE